MKPLKKSTGILAAVILIVMISGLLLANQMIDHLENNITTDYTKVYHDDLNRLLGEGWMVLAKESGYTVTPFDSTNIYTWEIGIRIRTDRSAPYCSVTLRTGVWNTHSDTA